MLKNLQIRSEAIGLAFLVCLNFTPGVAPAAQPKTDKTDNIVYVDNVTGDDANPGTYDAPKATIQAGEDAAEALYGNDGAVVVWGGGPAYEEGISITSSMRFHGNGLGLPNPGSPKARGNVPPPLVKGFFYATDIGSVTVRGFDVASPFIEGSVMLQNVNEAVCSDNFFYDFQGYSVSIPTFGTVTSSVRVENNRFNSMINSGGFCIYAQCTDSSRLTLVANKNTIEKSPWVWPITMVTRDTAEMTAQVDGNIIDGVTSGAAVWGTSEQDSVLRVEAKGNQITGGSMVRMESSGHSHLSARVSDSDIEGSPNGSIVGYGADNSTMDLHASGNSTYSNMAAGNFGALSASAFANSKVTAVFEDNEIQGTIGVSVSEQGVLDFTATGNVITRVPEFTGVPGIGVYGTFSAGVIHALISRNHIREATGDGIVLQEDGATVISVTDFGGNVIHGSAANGIHVDFAHPDSSVNGTKNNSVTESEGNSLEVVNEPVNGQIEVNGQTISPLVDTP
jgi:hypothetical protein